MQILNRKKHDDNCSCDIVEKNKIVERLYKEKNANNKVVRVTEYEYGIKRRRKEGW